MIYLEANTRQDFVGQLQQDQDRDRLTGWGKELWRESYFEILNENTEAAYSSSS